ncbi:MAG: hypothetical protein Q7U10_11295 [Thermodesulfovibrionia bacterium]|nr:hypothetical protein [Thermodesulfovibrionia bacterium]
MNNRRKAWLTIIGSASFILLIFISKIFITPKPDCNPDVKAKTLIIIDRTEEVATQTADLIVDRAWDFISNKVKEGEKVSVFSITEGSKKNLKPAFSMCKPRKNGNRFFENAKKVNERFKINFEEPLRLVISAPIGSENETPLAQGLIDLSLDDNSFRSSDISDVLIFSDFLENTSCFSMYKNCLDGQAAIKQFRNCRVGAVERPKFKNICIRMNIIPRTNNADITQQTLSCRAMFWNWFFGDSEGNTCVGEVDNPHIIIDYMGGG